MFLRIPSVQYIRKRWDSIAESSVKRSRISSIKKITWDYLVNEHSEDSERWYTDAGIIKFCYQGQELWLHYCYNNINHLENLEYYKNLGLEEMERSEYTSLILSISKTVQQSYRISLNILVAAGWMRMTRMGYHLWN